MWTGAVDEAGIPVELSAYDIQRLTRPEIDQYRADREAKIEALDAERIEADDERQFTEAFVSNGGRERDAAAAFRAHRNEQAAQAAAMADAEAEQATRRRARSVL